MKSSRKDSRIRRKMKIKKTVVGTSAKPRVFLFRSNKHYYVGVADDSTHTVLASMMTKGKSGENVEEMGKAFGKKLKELEISQIVFDRSGYRYHGNVKILADSIRSEGLQF